MEKVRPWCGQWPSLGSRTAKEQNRTEQDCDKMDDFCTKPVHAANETACGGLRRLAAAAWGSAGEPAAAACRYVADNDIDELNDLRARTPSPPPPLPLQFCIDFSATRLSRLDNTSSFDRQRLSGRRHELAVSDACAVRRDDVTTPRDRSFAALGRRQPTGHAVIAVAAAAARRHGVCDVVLTRLIIARPARHETD